MAKKPTPDDVGLPNNGIPVGDPVTGGAEWSEWAQRIEQRVTAIEETDASSAATEERLNGIEERLNKVASDAELNKPIDTSAAVEQRLASLEQGGIDRRAADDKWGKDISDRLDAIERNATDLQTQMQAAGGYVTRAQLTAAMEQVVAASRPSSDSAYVTRSQLETIVDRKIEAAKHPFGKP